MKNNQKYNNLTLWINVFIWEFLFLKKGARRRKFYPKKKLVLIKKVISSFKFYFIEMFISIKYFLYEASVCQRCFAFWLSKHILCKESIVIAKKFDFEILTYLYVLRSLEFIYTIFTVMYECMYVCVRVYVSEHDGV